MDDNQQDDKLSFHESAFVKAIEDAVHTINVTVFTPGQDPEKDKGHLIRVDQRKLMKDIKEQLLQPLVPDLTLGEFLVFRERSSYYVDPWCEVTNMLGTLQNNVIGSTPKLWLKKGHALKPGEYMVTLYLFRLGKKKALEEWCSIPVPGTMLGRDLKAKVLEQYKIMREDALARKQEAAKQEAAKRAADQDPDKKDAEEPKKEEPKKEEPKKEGEEDNSSALDFEVELTADRWV